MGSDGSDHRRPGHHAIHLREEPLAAECLLFLVGKGEDRYASRHMRVIPSGKEGTATLVGIAFAIISFIATALNIEIVSRVGGFLVLTAIISLFMPKYRPWGKGFLLGGIGTLVIVGVGALLVSIVIVALDPSLNNSTH
jgi:hypothetical protein